MTSTTAPSVESDKRRHEALNVVRGGGFIAGGKAFEYFTRFFVALLLARLLSPGDYGLYVLALGTGALFASVAAMGLDDAMVRYVSILATRRDRPGLLGTLQIGIGLSLLGAVVMGVAGYLLADPIATGLFEEPELATLLRVMALLIPFLTLSNMLQGVARGFERMDIPAVSENVVQSLVRLGLLALLALVGQVDVMLAVIIYGLSDVAASATFLVMLHRQAVEVGDVARGPVRRDVRPVFGFAMPLWLSGILRQGRGRIQSIVLGVTLNVAGVGVYAILERVTVVGQVVLQSIFVAVKPVLARMHDQGDREGLGNLYRSATRWTLTLYLPFFVVVATLAEPILGIFGTAFQVGATAMTVLVLAELVNAGTGICRSMIDMTGRSGLKLLHSVLFTVILIGGDVLLIPRYGLLGAAFATLAATTTVNVLAVVQVWWLERLQPFDLGYLKPLAAAAAAAVASRALGGLWSEVHVASALADVVVMGTTYLGVLVLLGLDPDDRFILRHVMGAAGRRAGISRFQTGNTHDREDTTA